MELHHEDSDILLDDMGTGLGATINQPCLKPKFDNEETKENINSVANQKKMLRNVHSPSNV